MKTLSFTSKSNLKLISNLSSSYKLIMAVGRDRMKREIVLSALLIKDFLVWVSLAFYLANFSHETMNDDYFDSSVKN